MPNGNNSIRTSLSPVEQSTGLTSSVGRLSEPVSYFLIDTRFKARSIIFPHGGVMELFEVHLPFFKRYAEIYNPLPVENPLFIVFWLVLYAAFLKLLNWAILKRERLRIRFYITDFWAATLALLPALYLLTDLTDSDSSVRWRQLGHFGLAFFSTLGGIYAWLILSLLAKATDGLPLADGCTLFRCSAADSPVLRGFF